MLLMEPGEATIRMVSILLHSEQGKTLIVQNTFPKIFCVTCKYESMLIHTNVLIRHYNTIHTVSQMRSYISHAHAHIQTSLNNFFICCLMFPSPPCHFTKAAIESRVSFICANCG